MDSGASKLYSKNDFFNRNKIKTKNGGLWITVPVKASSKQESMLLPG